MARPVLNRALETRLRARAAGDRARLDDERFTIISSDCWGAEVYRHLGAPYQTPFVGLFLPAPDFLTLLEDPQAVIAADLSFHPRSRYQRYPDVTYPIGRLGGEAEVHFVHHPDPATAESAWRRRAERIAWDRLFVKLSADKDLCTPALVERFAGLPYAKVCLTRWRYPGVACAHQVRPWTENGAWLFPRTHPGFDVVAWLNAGADPAPAADGREQPVTAVANWC